MATSTQFAYRTLQGIGIVDAAPKYQALSGFEPPAGNCRCCTYSPCGQYFGWSSNENVTVVETTGGKVVTSLKIPNVNEIGFSPRGSYLITLERPSKNEAGDAVKNLKVWRTVEDLAPGVEKEVVGLFVQKSQSGWNLQYTFDEKYCARVVTNEVQFYESVDLGKVWTKLRAEGVSDFSISQSNNQSVAIFIPERKGQPASVKIFHVPQFNSPVSQKTFFKGDKVQLKWNQHGTTLIVLAQTEVDKTGKSYYGETTLYVLSANGGFDSRITLDKEGPIHDVSWSPNSKEFGVIYGYMPAKTTIFNSKAVATHSFPLSPRNTILFSPSGRFVLVAGFGNLAGQMDIYDLEKNFKKICTIEGGNPSVCEWSPDSTYILTATTSPRLRVDNGIRIWHVGGSLMYNQDMTDLYHVTWKPHGIFNLPDVDPLNTIPTPHESALAYLGTVKTPSKPTGAYRPPGARGSSTPLHFKREDEGGAAYIVSNSSPHTYSSGFSRPRRQVPGAETINSIPGGELQAPGGDENLSKTALKNKKKREAKKAKEADAKAASTLNKNGQRDDQNDSESRDRREHIRSQSKSRQDTRAHSQQVYRNSISQSSGNRPNPPYLQNQNQQEYQNNSANPNSIPKSSDSSLISPNGVSQHSKKLRALQKKIRAIEDLELRLAGGEILEDTQLKKISTKVQVQAELLVMENE